VLQLEDIFLSKKNYDAGFEAFIALD